MSDERKRRGRLGEDAALHFLVGQGYDIVARNWSRPCGELDLVARESAADGDTLVIVEVKTRRIDGAVAPELAVDWRKRRQLQRVGRAFAAEWRHAPWRSIRIDVIGIEVDERDRVAAIRHYRDIG